jgi:Cu/Ag efflux protein CusF
MKTLKATTWVAVCASVLTTTAAFRASADESATILAQNDRSPAAARNDKSYTGIITAVDSREQVVYVKNWAMFTRKFNLGANCFYAQAGKDNAPASDLRSGEKVTVSYQSSHGILIADRVQQMPMRFTGTVIAIDNDKHVLTLHQPRLDKQLTIPADSRIALRDGKTGHWSDVKIGSYVTATYEMPANEPTVRQVAQTTIPFTGTLTAVDTSEKTLKAKTAFSTKNFQIADNCVIVVNGRTDGQLADLKLNDKLLFNYDEVDGVNVVTRIGPSEMPANSVAVNPSPYNSLDYGY